MTASAAPLPRADLDFLPELAEKAPTDWPTRLIENLAGSAAQEEMAQTICDVLLRRTMLSHLGCPPAHVTTAVGRVLAKHLDWDAQTLKRQIKKVDSEYRRMGLSTRAASF